jgi:hypothetical protein
VSEQSSGADRADDRHPGATDGQEGSSPTGVTTDGEADTNAGSDDDALELGPAADPVAVARRRHGAAGAMLAAGLFGVDVALGRKPREDIPVVVASNSEPTDIDADGIDIGVDDSTRVVSPALPRSEPSRPRRARRARRTR